jgi:hypothetical protein
MDASLTKAARARRQEKSNQAQALIRDLYDALGLVEDRLSGTVDGDDVAIVIATAIQFIRQHHELPHSGARA